MSEPALEQRIGTRKVAALLACTQQHVVNLVRAGELDGINVAVGKERPMWAITVSSVRRFVSARSNETPMNPTSVSAQVDSARVVADGR